MNIKKSFVILFLIFLYCPYTFALEPQEVLVVANLNAKHSKELAQYYMDKRQIPTKNLVLLSMTDKETCTRDEYIKTAIPPIKKFLDHNNHIRAIVTMFGVPLRIASPGRTKSEKIKLHKLNKLRQKFENQLFQDGTLESKTKSGDHSKLSDLKKNISDYKKSIDKVASFDSELSLVKKNSYDLNMWLPNPYYIGFRNQTLDIKRSEVLITSRLDGATAKIVKRIINDTIEAETQGLKGSAYFDARWKDPGREKKLEGYAFYDRSIHGASQLLIKEKKINVVLDDDHTLFQKGQCPDAALYCGWYSLAKYIDAFKWEKGSVGYHIASSECKTLKKPHSNVWCKKMLDNGIAATIGPVGEPYVQAFPVPEIFFNFLTEGYLTLAESYIISLPYISWKMVLI
ncbi:MAG: TIGR03790 family protein, partial [Desulfobacula sp.]|nr:TIGR03790 family protein [Desulfobacula sp.]